MECEVCGKPEGPYLVLIEGARLHACASCSRMGKLLQAPRAPSPVSGSGSPHGSGRSLANAAPEFELVDGFGAIMKKARERMHIPLSVLAERLFEKESFLERIEHEGTHPSVALARKIEKELGIQLLEESGDLSSLSGGSDSSSGKGGITLGDILQIERKKKKESK